MRTQQVAISKLAILGLTVLAACAAERSVAPTLTEPPGIRSEITIQGSDFYPHGGEPIPFQADNPTAKINTWNYWWVDSGCDDMPAGTAPCPFKTSGFMQGVWHQGKVTFKRAAGTSLPDVASDSTIGTCIGSDSTEYFTGETFYFVAVCNEYMKELESDTEQLPCGKELSSHAEFDAWYRSAWATFNYVPISAVITKRVGVGTPTNFATKVGAVQKSKILEPWSTPKCEEDRPGGGHPEGDVCWEVWLIWEDSSGHHEEFTGYKCLPGYFLQ